MFKVIIVLLIIDIMFNIISTILITLQKRKVNKIAKDLSLLKVRGSADFENITSMISSIIDIMEK